MPEYRSAAASVRKVCGAWRLRNQSLLSHPLGTSCTDPGNLEFADLGGTGILEVEFLAVFLKDSRNKI